MTNLRDYITKLDQSIDTAGSSVEDDAMRRLKKYAQVDLDGSEGLYETTIDRWSRNAKHQLSKSEVAGAIEQPIFEEGETVVYEGEEVQVKIPQGPKGTAGVMVEGHLKMVHQSKLTKIEEGVMGGVQTMTPINRIMQLAGLEHTGVVAAEVTEDEVTEDAADELEEEIVNEDGAGNMFNQLLTKNQNDPNYKNNPDAARLLTVGQVLAGLQSVIKELPSGIPPNIVNELKVVPGIGVSLIQAAKDLTKKGTTK